MPRHRLGIVYYQKIRAGASLSRRRAPKRFQTKLFENTHTLKTRAAFVFVSARAEQEAFFISFRADPEGASPQTEFTYYPVFTHTHTPVGIRGKNNLITVMLPSAESVKHNMTSRSIPY